MAPRHADAGRGSELGGNASAPPGRTWQARIRAISAHAGRGRQLLWSGVARRTVKNEDSSERIYILTPVLRAP